MAPLPSTKELRESCVGVIKDGSIKANGLPGSTRNSRCYRGKAGVSYDEPLYGDLEWFDTYLDIAFFISLFIIADCISTVGQLNSVSLRTM